MEQKTWLWKIQSNKSKTLKALKEEAEKGQELEKSLKQLSEKLTSLLTESEIKDNLLLKQEKVAEEALAGWEKAEANAASLKKELDDALQQTLAAEEKVQNLDKSLKECMQQLCVFKQERERMLGEVAEKATREEQKVRILEERLAEMKKTVAELVSDNDCLNAILEDKEKMIKSLNDEKACEEENFKVILAKFDSSEKQNASLKYEVYMLGKELQIRNEEKDFNLRSVKAAHKQHLSSVKKITELEEECNKLRVMLRKRLPGPAALAKMKTEVELLGGNTSEAPKKKSNLSKSSSTSNTDSLSIRPSGKRDVLVDKIREMEAENKLLKDELSKKNRDLQTSRLTCAHTASKLSHAEKQLEGLCRTAIVETETCNTQALNSESGCNDDVLSSSESWASALVSELEHFKNGKPATPSGKTSVSDISLMDDFVQMEKLALTTSVRQCEKPAKPEGNDHVSATATSGSRDMNGESQSSYASNEGIPCLLKDSLKSILQKHHLEKGDIDAILEESRVALSDTSCLDSRDSPNSVSASNDIFSNSQDVHGSSLREADCKQITHQFQTNLDKTICELIEVVQDIKEKCLIDHIDDKVVLENNDNVLPQKNFAKRAEFVSWAFQCRSSELTDVLESFLRVCNGLLRGSIGLQKFIHGMTSTISWIVDHSTPTGKDSSFDMGSTCDRSKLCLGMGEPYPEMKIDRSSVPEEVKLTIEVPLFKSHSEIMQEKSSGLDRIDGHRNRDDFVSTETENRCMSVSQELIKTHRRTLSLQVELERLKEANGLMDYHPTEHKPRDGHSQILVSNPDLGQVVKIFPSLQEALEDRSSSPKDPKEVHLDPQLHPGSCTTEEKPYPSIDQDQKQPITKWEISAASEKLAECQETILTIEKQLKALTSSGNNSASHEKSSHSDGHTKTRHCLGDQLLIEASKKSEEIEKERCDTQLIPRTSSSTDNVGLLYGTKLSNSSRTSQIKSPRLRMIGVEKHKNGDSGNALAIVPRKQRPRISLWRRLLLRRNKESGRKVRVF